MTQHPPIPPELQAAVSRHLASHPAWNAQRFWTAAGALMLMQNGSSDRVVNRLYLETLFDYQETQNHETEA